jgi:predicted alpha/beta hydrolase family esterase
MLNLYQSYQPVEEKVMHTVVVGSMGGYAGSVYPHPQRQLDATLRAAGYHVNELELPQNTAPELETCRRFLLAQCTAFRTGILILHSLASRLFLLTVEHLRAQGQLDTPLADTVVLLAPANGSYIAEWVPVVAAFFTQDIWVPSLDGAARRLLIAASHNDPYWEEAETDLAQFRQQASVDVIVLPQQGHLNEAEVSGDLPAVRTWIMQAKPPTS